MYSSAVKKERIIKAKSEFGRWVDYHLFAIKSPKTFTQMAVSLGEACNCTFTLLPDFIYPRDKMHARFRMAYHQFESRNTGSDSFGENIEKVNCILLQNRTTRLEIDKIDKGLLAKSRLMETLPFDDENIVCYALNSTGLCLARIRNFKNFDYLFFIYAKKNYNADRFCNFFAGLTDFLKIEKSDMLFKEENSGNNISVTLLQSICQNAEKQITAFSHSAFRFFLGSLPNTTANLPGKPNFSPHILSSNH